jgi:predicted ferric reductase
MTSASLSRDRARSRRRANAVQALPRAYAGVGAFDVGVLLAFSAALVVAMWLRHHGATILDDPWASIGQVAALGGTWASLVGVLFAARAPWLDQVVGTDRLRVIHRWTGFAAVWLLAIHGITSVYAFAGDSASAVPGEVIRLLLTVPGMLGGLVSGGLFVLVAVTSIRAARRRLSFEAWHGIHLYVYLAVAFGFLHQLTIGSDFTSDPLARAFWIGLYALAFAPLVAYRIVEPIVRSLRHGYRVESIIDEAPGVFSIVVSGRDLNRLPVRSGQYFVIRALDRGWWRGHPFSLSAAPRAYGLRFTVKEYGDGSSSYRSLRSGTRLLLEGPYGVLHGGKRTRRRLLFIAAGIGVTPIRALAEGMAYGPGEATLIYRAPSERDLVHREELDALVAHRGLDVRYLIGRRGGRNVGRNPFGPEGLVQMTPDLVARDIYVCGPSRMMDQVLDSLRRLGVPSEHVHAERFT